MKFFVKNKFDTYLINFLKIFNRKKFFNNL